VVVAVPENHAATCGAKKVGAQQAQKAEDAGYSMDLCSYARIDIGTAFDSGRGSPSNGLPKPDLLISCTNNCSLLSKWFDVHHRELGVPHIVLDVPFCYGPQQEKDLNYILTQYQDLIAKLEDITGQQYDPAKVQEAWRYSVESYQQWQRFLDTAAHRPAGITAFDTFLHMAPALTFYRGTPTIVEHFKLLAEEAEAKIANGNVPVPNERYRLLWDNIAPWHQLRRISSWLAERDANLIAATYTSCIGRLEGGVDWQTSPDADPLSELARAQNFSVCPYGLELRYNSLAALVNRLQPDGIIFSSNRSCKPYSLMQMDLQRRVEAELGLPAVMIDCDMADERFYNEAQAFLRIEALLERIDSQRGST
ncbi:MAG TPA: 2-hydroxyacyl-CoA dehydratase family protein, partial [Candidatus Lokiarchaeia archaeon]|nr:2-hydroxyacyl-CoA dehydratase family protein [Candidatus Lokiarchaeia archaeon]